MFMESGWSTNRVQSSVSGIQKENYFFLLEGRNFSFSFFLWPFSAIMVDTERRECDSGRTVGIGPGTPKPLCLKLDLEDHLYL